MVIVIIAIIASVTLPKFANFKTTATDNSEDAIFGNMNASVKILHTSYLVNGNDSYPSECPLSLLTIIPKHVYWTTEGYPDGETWRIYKTWVPAWYIYCPHWNGPAAESGAGTRGRFYIYTIVDYAGWGGVKAGRFFKLKPDSGGGH